DKDALRAAITDGTFDTINGEVRFDGVQNSVTPTAFVQRQGDKVQLVWPKDIATAPLQ
ncbi:MAG: hypothetical protein ACKVIA_12530, partial [Rhodobacterales bacterium]